MINREKEGDNFLAIDLIEEDYLEGKKRTSSVINLSKKVEAFREDLWESEQ